MSYPRFTFQVAGYSDIDTMWFEPGPAECGYITDGVCLGHDDNAGFVVDYSDLRKMYLAAREKRRRIAAGEEN